MPGAPSRRTRAAARAMKPNHQGPEFENHGLTDGPPADGALLASGPATLPPMAQRRRPFWKGVEVCAAQFIHDRLAQAAVRASRRMACVRPAR